MARQKIIYDCDPGHDDAVALMLAANSPELELLGVTVAAGNQTLDNTARNACHVLQWLGREDVPVYAGCGQPMVRDHTCVMRIGVPTIITALKTKLKIDTRKTTEKKIGFSVFTN